MIQIPVPQIQKILRTRNKNNKENKQNHNSTNNSNKAIDSKYMVSDILFPYRPRGSLDISPNKGHYVGYFCLDSCPKVLQCLHKYPNPKTQNPKPYTILKKECGDAGCADVIASISLRMADADIEGRKALLTALQQLHVCRTPQTSLTPSVWGVWGGRSDVNKNSPRALADGRDSTPTPKFSKSHKVCFNGAGQDVLQPRWRQQSTIGLHAKF